jgi:hypothetical protein
VHESFSHPGTKETRAKGFGFRCKTYLPKRYQADKAFVVDSTGTFSEQIDVVIYDQQILALSFNMKGQIIVPAERLCPSLREAEAEQIKAKYAGTHVRK